MNKHFVIYNESSLSFNLEDDALYWSNEFGWAGLTSATVFTEAETEMYNLPDDGKFVQLPKGC
jgi:hypothetical protein